jgi:hypothetical protein
MTGLSLSGELIITLRVAEAPGLIEPTTSMEAAMWPWGQGCVCTVMARRKKEQESKHKLKDLSLLKLGCWG